MCVFFFSVESAAATAAETKKKKTKKNRNNKPGAVEGADVGSTNPKQNINKSYANHIQTKHNILKTLP